MVKVLVVTSKHRDHLASCLWDGLQQVLGEENVVDAVGCPFLHRSQALDYLSRHGEPAESGRHFNTAFVAQAISGTREGRLLHADENDFDLLVIHSCFRDDFDWSQVQRDVHRLKAGGKVAYVEGQDDARYVIPPHVTVDAVFRKEIDEHPYFYGHTPHHLTFAAPERWFHPLGPEAGRDIDVLFIGNPETNGADRQLMIRECFRTRRKLRVVAATVGLGWPDYFRLLRRTKLALCPSTAAGADSTRTYEAVACGAVPVFVDYPPRPRDPWFPAGACVNCTAETLADHLDSALGGHDLSEMRARLRKWALVNHTTRARALKVLTTLGFQAGRDF